MLGGPCDGCAGRGDRRPLDTPLVEGVGIRLPDHWNTDRGGHSGIQKHLKEWRQQEGRIELGDVIKSWYLEVNQEDVLVSQNRKVTRAGERLNGKGELSLLSALPGFPLPYSHYFHIIGVYFRLVFDDWL